MCEFCVCGVLGQKHNTGFTCLGPEFLVIFIDDRNVFIEEVNYMDTLIFEYFPWGAGSWT